MAYPHLRFHYEWLGILVRLGTEEATVGEPPLKKKKTMSGVKKIYKWSPQVFYDMSSSHTVEDLCGLLVAGLEFLDLGIEKIEADHPVHGFDILLARLEERRPSNWDVLASLKQYIEAIEPANYLLAASVDPT